MFVGVAILSGILYVDRFSIVLNNWDVFHVYSLFAIFGFLDNNFIYFWNARLRFRSLFGLNIDFYGTYECGFCVSFIFCYLRQPIHFLCKRKVADVEHEIISQAIETEKCFCDNEPQEFYR